MFVRTKPSGRHKYLQVVESFREGRKVRQRVVATLGRLDRLQAEGNIDGIVKSLSRFALKVRLVEGHKSGRLRAGEMRRIGPAIVVERLWREGPRDRGRAPRQGVRLPRRARGLPHRPPQALRLGLRPRRGQVPAWRQTGKRDYRIEGADGLELHHLYRAMAWLGESKDGVEASLFAVTRDLFTELEMVFPARPDLPKRH